MSIIGTVKGAEALSYYSGGAKSVGRKLVFDFLGFV
jgi:hypothetical protein